MEQAVHLLRELAREKFFGSVELKFEAGLVVLIRKSQTLKPHQSRHGDNWSHNEYDFNATK